MHKTYTLIKEDGTVAILRLIEGGVEEVISKLPYKVVSFTEVDEKDVPKDRAYRDAWSKDLSVDLDKAKKIHMARIRERRNKLLEQEDLAFVTALSKDDVVEVEKVKQRKKKLRDVPQVIQASIDQATTVEDLKKVEPQW